MNEERHANVDVTLLVCTFNRSADLRELLETALAQENDGTFTFEVLVVDNNSSDETRTVVKTLIAHGHRAPSLPFRAQAGEVVRAQHRAGRGSRVDLRDRGR
jgi:glycosyltransferase involved in cell wall biosynthesis